MTAEGTRFARAGRHAALAVIASVLFASCSTSDPDVPFGFAAAAPSGLAAQTGDLTSRAAADSATPGTLAEAPVPATEFVMDADDPALPDAIASAPALRPVSAAEAAAAEASATAQPPPEPTAQAAAPAPQPREAAQQQAPAEEQAAQATAEAAPQTGTTEEQVAAFAPPVEQPKKRGFLSALFGGQPANTAPAAPQKTAQPVAKALSSPTPAPTAATPVIQLASTGPAAKPLMASAASAGTPPLPGVRQNGLFEISRRSGLDDDSDIDIYEDEEPRYQVASAAGLARLAPNGLLKQTEHVDVACLKPSLVRVLKAVERHYGRKMVVTSGYRSQDRNRRARGARNSLHMYCAAADVQVEGVSKWDLAQFVRTMPGRGGVGTYCHTDSVHIDVGPERDWNWRCRRRK